jgi:tetratricopeptide (TPR) repeat protein
MSENRTSRLSFLKRPLPFQASCFNICALLVVLVMLGASTMQAFDPSGAPEPALSADEAFSQGISALENDNLEIALSHFHATIEGEPDNGPAHFYIGQIYVEMELFESALRALDRAVELAPNNALAYDYRGHTLLQLEEPQKPIEEFNLAISRDDINSDTFLYQHQSEFSRAVQS